MAFLAKDVSIILGILAVAFCVDLYAKRRRMLALTPPGPTPLPYLGNVFDIPSDKPWEMYSEWSKKYNSKCQSPIASLSFTAVRRLLGDLVSVRVLGELSVIVNSAEAAKEIFGKRASIYSSRPNFKMVEMYVLFARKKRPAVNRTLFRIGWDWNFALMPYGERWRTQRRYMHQAFHSGVVSAHFPAQAAKVSELVVRLRDSPGEFRGHIKQ
jgi:cytochrome P450